LPEPRIQFRLRVPDWSPQGVKALADVRIEIKERAEVEERHRGLLCRSSHSHDCRIAIAISIAISIAIIAAFVVVTNLDAR